MKQNAEKIQVQVETSKSSFSPFGGMAILKKANEALHLDFHLDDAIGIGKTKAKQSITDHEIIESLVAMQLLGGDSADGIERIKKDQVLTRLWHFKLSNPVIPSLLKNARYYISR